MLLEVAETDSGVRHKLHEMNVVLKDRKISNVIEENSDFKQRVEDLIFENEKLRD